MKRTCLFVLVCLVSIACSGQGAEDCTESDFLQGMEPGEKAALLLVHFGTTHDDTRALTMDALRTKVKKRFASLEVYEAYTSRIVVKRLKTRGIAKRTPLEMLLKLCAEGYTRVLVQSTNIISGLENESLRREVERVRPFFKEVRLGNPLLYEVEDVEKVVAILTGRHPADKRKGQHVVFVGHGTSTPATAIYSELDYMLKADGYSHYHVGTIEGYPTFDTMLARLKSDKAKQVTLVPLMFVAGEHAKHDISVEWKENLEEKGLKVLLRIEGLGQIPEIQDIFIDHIRHALKHRAHDIMEKKDAYSKQSDSL